VSEPRAVAEHVEEVVPGVWHWRVHDERIDFVSAAHAVSSPEGSVLIDPLPLAPKALASLGEVTAVCLTAGTHQRSAWRYRRELGAAVYAPALSRQIEEEPDERYEEGADLPGGLRAVFTPGAGTTQHTFVVDRDGGVAFVADLLTHHEDRGLRMVQARYMHDPAEARRSLEKLLDLPFSILCLAHGTPVTDDPKAAIWAVLESS
jgi:glyoxylase-like metal-dependent hydrolase (beta-lactamase superfamily II)